MLERMKEIELEKAQILDFYLAFPSALAGVRWPRELRVSRKELKGLATPYRDPMSARATFRSMREVQSAACSCLVASKLIEARALELGVLRRTESPITEELELLSSSFVAREQRVVDLVFGCLGKIPLLGHEGLKARTDLLEYRYDAH